MFHSWAAIRLSGGVLTRTEGVPQIAALCASLKACAKPAPCPGMLWELLFHSCCSWSLLTLSGLQSSAADT